MCARKRVEIFFQVPHPLLDTPTKYTIMKFCSAADVCVPKTMYISSLLMDNYIKTWCSLYYIILNFYFILYLPLNPLPYLGHPMRVFSLDLNLVNKIPQCIRGNPT